MVTVAGWLLRNPLFTMSCNTYMPGRSATKAGFAMAAFDRTAALPAGFEVNDHKKVRGLPCGSVPLPASVTMALLATVWFGPALAVGGSTLLVVMVTVAAALSTFPSFTINCATYVPPTSAVNVGFTAVVLLKAAALPAGFVIRLHE